VGAFAKGVGARLWQPVLCSQSLRFAWKHCAGSAQRGLFGSPDLTVMVDFTDSKNKITAEIQEVDWHKAQFAYMSPEVFAWACV